MEGTFQLFFGQTRWRNFFHFRFPARLHPKTTEKKKEKSPPNKPHHKTKEDSKKDQPRKTK